MANKFNIGDNVISTSDYPHIGVVISISRHDDCIRYDVKISDNRNSVLKFREDLLCPLRNAEKHMDAWEAEGIKQSKEYHKEIKEKIMQKIQEINHETQTKN
ncbi:hypothetical protein LCGC14_1162870 [marine sediment metagenome]|uniref:Uncharacterized protein n=1 Tax=marine sediment metagenome TaxID=412755 RepID=A0A0F9PXP8_9ZZZZ|nr:hypothetical protein [Candidatus Scalindua sp.]